MCTCGHTRANHSILPLVVQDMETASKLPFVNQRQMITLFRRQRRVADQTKVLIQAKIKVVGAPKRIKRKTLTPADRDRMRKEKLAREAKQKVIIRVENYEEFKRRVIEEVPAWGDGATKFLFKDMDDLWPTVQREALYVHRPGANADQETVSLVTKPPDLRGTDATLGSQPPPFVMSMRMMWVEVSEICLPSQPDLRGSRRPD
jgi:hypothetical protein